jgi:hypothetical protein
MNKSTALKVFDIYKTSSENHSSKEEYHKLYSQLTEEEQNYVDRCIARYETDDYFIIHKKS